MSALPVDKDMDDEYVICLCTTIRAKDKVSLFLCYLFTYFENRLLPKNIIIIRNHVDDDRVLKDRHRGGEDQQGTSNPSQSPKQYQTSPPRIPEPYFTKTNALVTYGVRFGRSIYDWNQNFIELPMAMVPP
jgi:hypothetical protein